ncbi:MAG: periplasmic heavy metal sensor [Bacteroidales bacterium]
MKKLSILTLSLVLTLSLSAQQLVQRGPGYAKANPLHTALNLNENQSSAIEALRIEKLGELNKLNNLQREYKAQLITLKQATNPDQKAINAKIDQLTELHNKRLKLNAQHELKVRALLTDEQKVEWDARKARNMGRGTRGRNMSPAMGGRFNNNRANGPRTNRENTNRPGVARGAGFGPGYMNSNTVIDQ